MSELNSEELNDEPMTALDDEPEVTRADDPDQVTSSEDEDAEDTS